MKKTLDKLAEILGYFAGILFFVIFILNIVEIISRSFFNYSFLWISDFSVLCIVWVICLGMAISIYYSEHIVIDFLPKKLHQKGQRILGSIISVVIIVFLVMLFFTSLKTVAAKRELIFPTLMWSLVWSYSALPVFAFLSIIFMIPRLLNLLKGKSLAPNAEEKDRENSIA
jgi:TRAP-type C4-dicarboxylate transport system permease small subunit